MLAEGEMTAVFDVVGIPHEKLDQFLEDNDKLPTSPGGIFWLAEDYENVEDVDSTEVPVSREWKSPFVGKSIDDIVAFMTGLPEDQDSIERHFFIVLDEDLRKKGEAKYYRYLPADTRDEHGEGGGSNGLSCYSASAGEAWIQMTHEQCSDWDRRLEGQSNIVLTPGSADWWDDPRYRIGYEDLPEEDFVRVDHVSKHGHPL